MEQCKAICRHGIRCKNPAILGGMCLSHYKMYAGRDIPKGCEKCDELKICKYLRTGDPLRCKKRSWLKVSNNTLQEWKDMETKMLKGGHRNMNRVIRRGD